MKKVFFLLVLAGFTALGACSRKTCPAYSQAPATDTPAAVQQV